MNDFVFVCTDALRPGYFNFQMAVFTPPDNLRFVDKNKKIKEIKILYYFIIEMTRNTEIQIKICPPLNSI